MISIGTINLDYNRTELEQGRDLHKLSARDVHVICTQEDVRGLHRERIQLTLAGRRAGIIVLDRGRHRANPTVMGYLIRRRWYAWALLAVPGLDTHVYVVSVHFPPARMPYLYPLFARRLRRFLNNLDHPWIVGGDWNRRLGEDPARLRRRFGARWKGHRIDGFAVHPDLTTLVTTVERPRIRSARLHPVVVINLKGADQ